MMDASYSSGRQSGMSWGSSVRRVSTGQYEVTLEVWRTTGASLVTLMRRNFIYPGGRKARSAARRLQRYAKRFPWAVLLASQSFREFTQLAVASPSRSGGE